MENKTSYTLQDAKNEIAIERGRESSNDYLRKIKFHFKMRCIRETESFMDDAAELYKEKATEELRKELEASQVSYKLLHKDSIAEIERLTQSNKELVEALKIAEAAHRRMCYSIVHFCPDQSTEMEAHAIMLSALKKSKP